MAEFYNNSDIKTSSLTKFVLRFVTASIVLAITAFLTPGFTIAGLWPLLLSAAVISILDFALTRAGLDVSPFGRGVTGFILSAVVLYFTQYFVAGFSVTMFGAIIGALVYGVIDAFIPGKAL